ncbi:MAG: ZIP family metal transporter [Erysipelotrichaceae bacterium]|nr:ZIP family metal transporter [Erysipelotrichaceae bacterium]
MKDILIGLLIPFLGTTLGSGCVYLLKGKLKRNTERILQGFAAGVMTAASVWSLLIPAMEQSEHLERMAFLPSLVGLALGIAFMLVLDEVVPHMHLDESEEGMRSAISKTGKMMLAVTIHNIPEGMAVGVLYAGLLSGSSGISAAGALALSLGIAIQNFPEGAIISMPLRANGEGVHRSFLLGVLSGAVEPVAGGLTILALNAVVPAMPYLLSFAAGAMIYVVVEELIPEMSEGVHSNLGTIFFAAGFAVMMALDTALG